MSYKRRFQIAKRYYTVNKESREEIVVFEKDIDGNANVLMSTEFKRLESDYKEKIHKEVFSLIEQATEMENIEVSILPKESAFAHANNSVWEFFFNPGEIITINNLLQQRNEAQRKSK